MIVPFLPTFTKKNHKQGGTNFKSDQHFFGPFLKYEKQKKRISPKIKDILDLFVMWFINDVNLLDFNLDMRMNRSSRIQFVIQTPFDAFQSRLYFLPLIVV